MTREQQAIFRKVVLDAFEPDLMAPGQTFRSTLLIRPLPRQSGLYEMSWGDGGRAAFSYSAARRAGEPHVIWWQITSAAHNYRL